MIPGADLGGEESQQARTLRAHALKSPPTAGPAAYILASRAVCPDAPPDPHADPRGEPPGAATPHATA